MEERSNHITVIIGASEVAEDLRRRLVRRKVAHAGVATHLRGLRKSMALGHSDLMIVCIALDQPTIHRHGNSLRKLLADCHCFPQAVRSVGLLPEVGLTRDTAEMGCDVYAQDSAAAARAVQLLTKRWQLQKNRQRSTYRRKRPAASSTNRHVWVWGTDQIPQEFSSIFSDAGSFVAGAAADSRNARQPSSAGASRLARSRRRNSSPRRSGN